MEDFLGKELNIGDEVIYIHYNSRSSQYLVKGTIISFRGITQAVIKPNNSCINRRKESQNIYKI